MVPHTKRDLQDTVYRLALFSQLAYRRHHLDGGPDNIRILQTLQSWDSGYLEVMRYVGEQGVAAILICHRHFHVLAFRGTDPIKNSGDAVEDWLTNLDATIERGAHRGFLHAVERMGGFGRKAARDAAEFNIPFYLTGHSQGGALAVIQAEVLRSYELPWKALCTFGAPRCLTKAVAARLDNYSRASHPNHHRMLRFQNRHDVVPYVPGWAMGYRHVGEGVYINKDNQLVENMNWRLQMRDWIGYLLRRHRRDYVARLCIRAHAIQNYVSAVSNWLWK